MLKHFQDACELLVVNNATLKLHAMRHLDPQHAAPTTSTNRIESYSGHYVYQWNLILRNIDTLGLRSRDAQGSCRTMHWAQEISHFARILRHGRLHLLLQTIHISFGFNSPSTHSYTHPSTLSCHVRSAYAAARVNARTVIKVLFWCRKMG